MTPSKSVAEALGGAPLFGALDRRLRERIAAEMHKVQFAAGQTIFVRDDPGSEVFLMLGGRVRLSVLTADGRELSFSHAVAGDVFGEIAVLDGSARSADATALTEVEALSLPAAAFERLIEQHPPLARAVIRFLCARLRVVSDHLEDIALLPIEARLARFLLNRLANGGSDLPEGPTRVGLGMSQSELALLLGASRPKVNAALAALEDAGAVERQGQDLVCRTRVLAEIAQRE
jgi:CRP-like cAMP-binding protein